MRYVKVSKAHLEQAKEMGVELPVEWQRAIDLQVDRHGPVLLPGGKPMFYAHGVMYASFWQYVWYTKNPLQIGRVVLSMALGLVAKPVLHRLLHRNGL